jgi:hypothetical protein
MRLRTDGVSGRYVICSAPGNRVPEAVAIRSARRVVMAETTSPTTPSRGRLSPPPGRRRRSMIEFVSQDHSPDNAGPLGLSP